MLKIIDFYATWCKPCTHLSKQLSELEEEYPNLEIVKIDIEKHPDEFKIHNVKSVPFIVFEKNDKIVHTIVGLQIKRVMKEIIDQYYE